MATTMNIQIDWNRITGRTTPLSYGLNAFQGFDPQRTGDPVYARNMAYMAPGLIRYHNGGMMGTSERSAGLINAAARGWDRDKVRRALTPRLFAGSQRMMNIANWPDWMDKDGADAKGDGFLDADQFDAYAALCADLVRIVNKEARLGVRYWEVTNERDGRYFVPFYEDNGKGRLRDPAKPDRVNELAALYNRCAVAMKKVDPTILVGGPAAARPDLLAFHTRFVRGTLRHLDFFSFHAYASGSKETPDEAVYDRAAGMGDYTRAIAQMLKRESPRRHIPLMLDEYNISWTWQTRDPRMTNHKGSVFDALAMVHAVRGGADVTAAWNEKDGIYGKTDGQNRLRPGAHVFHLFNRYLVGDVVQADTSEPKAIVAFAVRDRKTRRRACLLVNRSNAEHQAEMAFTNGRPVLRHQVSSVGFSKKPLRAEDSKLPLPEHSVTVLTWEE